MPIEAAVRSSSPLGPADPRSRGRFGVVAAAFLALTFALLLFRYPPADFGFYPACPIFRYFHLLCPGCGTTRALAALLRGRLHEALRWNAFTTCLAPLCVGYGTYFAAQTWRGSVPLRGSLHPALQAALLLGTALFGVLRNL